MKKYLFVLMLIPVILFSANNVGVGPEFPLTVPYFTVLGDLTIGGGLSLTDLIASGTVMADTFRLPTTGVISFGEEELNNDTIGCLAFGDDRAAVFSSSDKTVGRFYFLNTSNKIVVDAQSYSIEAVGGLDFFIRTRNATSKVVYFNQNAYGVRIDLTETPPVDGDSMLTVNGGASFTTGIEIGGLITKDTTVTLSDDGEWLAPTGVTSTLGYVTIGDYQEHADFGFTSAGVVTLNDNSTNVAAADTDGNLCIYQNAGTDGIIIKNRLGSSLKCGITIKYYTP